MRPNEFAALPKVELHLHLDCSLSFEVVHQLDPSISLADFKAEFIAPPKCHDLADYISFAIRPIGLMQTKEALRLVTLDLFDQLKADKVIYAEIRFAPLQHLDAGLSPKEVVEAVDHAMQEGIANTGVKAGLILCTLRHFTEDQSMKTVRLVDDFQGTTVVGFDIAADEAGFPIDNHIAAFQYAQQKGLNITAHAGEACGAESVRETLEHFGPTRIGHGVRSVEDPKLMTYLKKHKIHLEICPTSNVQTHVVDTIHDHPANQIYQAGISMGLNTDGRTISDVTLNQEYQTLKDHFAWTKAHFKKCNLEAIQHAFISDELKQELRAVIEAAYA